MCVYALCDSQRRFSTLVENAGAFTLDNVFINVDDIRSYGVALEADWVPSDSLAFRLVYTYLNTEIKNLGQDIVDLTDPNYYDVPASELAAAANNPCFFDNTGGIAPGCGVCWFHPSFADPADFVVDPNRVDSIESNRLPRSPEHSLTINATYFWAPSLGELSLGSTVAFQSEEFFSIFNDPETRQGTKTRVDLLLTWQHAERRWRMNTFVKNAFDEEMWQTASRSGFTEGSSTSVWSFEPRMFGLEIICNM